MVPDCKERTLCKRRKIFSGGIGVPLILEILIDFSLLERYISARFIMPSGAISNDIFIY
jgi:hypothetical protein